MRKSFIFGIVLLLVLGIAGGVWALDQVQESTVNREVLAKDIQETGKAAVYGIYFDTNKAVVKPDSDPTLTEIAGMLQDHPEMRLYVVGHTDMTGDFKYNMRLSQIRANAVVQILAIRYGISTKRLTAYGVGPLAPVASNRTDDGRAKNRRVELVER